MDISQNIKNRASIWFSHSTSQYLPKNMKVLIEKIHTRLDGETVETVSDFIFLRSKITADGDCSHEIKRRLLLGRKVMPNLDSIFKSRDITLPTKVPLVKAMVFPVVMYGCESWTVKKAECWRIDAFELWCWRRPLRVPWTARRSNQSILKEISPGISLEEMMLKLKLQSFGHLMWRVDSLEKTLMLGGIGGRRRRDNRRWDGWMASLTRWTWVWVNSGSQWWTGRLRFMGWQRVGHNWATDLIWSEWMEFHCYQSLISWFKNVFTKSCYPSLSLLSITFSPKQTHWVWQRRMGRRERAWDHKDSTSAPSLGRNTV